LLSTTKILFKFDGAANLAARPPSALEAEVITVDLSCSSSRSLLLFAAVRVGGWETVWEISIVEKGSELFRAELMWI
jgi:hypothetical protein